MSTGTIWSALDANAADCDTVRGPASGMMSWRDPGLVAAMLMLVPAVMVAVWWARPLGTPADLLSVWVAGEFWQMGRTGEIYPAATGLFTMLPPDGWVDWLAETQDYKESVFPFLYPPLWAVVMGWLAPSDFAPVAALSFWVNAGLLAASILLAIRACGAMLRPVAHVALVLVLFTTTHIASVGILQGQPHILVTFLIVLAIERSRAGAGIAAGTALAIAASIKLFPAVYAVIWLARGERRALASFILVGSALGAASILLAGWPLHRAFLESVGQIGRTLLVTGNNVSFDGIVGQLFAMDQVQVIIGPNLDAMGKVREAWLVAPAPELWSVLSKVGLLFVLAGTAFVARRLRRDALYAGLWPFLVTVSVVFTPTGWVYYVIPAAVFAPVMIAALPSARGMAVFLFGLVLFFSARLDALEYIEFAPIPGGFLYVAGALVWSLGFALTARDLARG